MSETENSTDCWETVAQHEAGHAVMRWLCGLPATALVARADGSGLNTGSGHRFPVADLLAVTLAGPAVEAHYGMFGVDWARTDFEDFDTARALLTQGWWLRVRNVEGRAVTLDVEAALRASFEDVCAGLWPYSELVDTVAEWLTWPVDRARVLGEPVPQTVALSARQVAALCREFDKRQAREAAA